MNVEALKQQIKNAQYEGIDVRIDPDELERYINCLEEISTHSVCCDARHMAELALRGENEPEIT